MRHYELSIRPFRQVACNKEQALKPLEEIKDDARWFIETYEREVWCEEVTRLGRQL